MMTLCTAGQEKWLQSTKFICSKIGRLLTVSCLRTSFQEWKKECSNVQKAQPSYMSRWVVGQRERPMEDLKVFIDVNVETVTNCELLLDNKICHASSTTYRLLLCIACITLYWTSFFSSQYLHLKI